MEKVKLSTRDWACRDITEEIKQLAQDIVDGKDVDKQAKIEEFSMIRKCQDILRSYSCRDSNAGIVACMNRGEKNQLISLIEDYFSDWDYMVPKLKVAPDVCGMCLSDMEVYYLQPEDLEEDEYRYFRILQTCDYNSTDGIRRDLSWEVNKLTK